MVNFVIGLEFLGICLNVIALILLLNGEGAKEQKLLLIIMCGSLVQNIGYLLELTAPTVEAAVTAVTVENVGSTFVPLCYCWFTYTYCYARPPKKLLRALEVINFFVLPTVFFNWNGLFYREFQWLSTPDGFHYVSISYGPLYTLFMITRIVIPYMLSICTLVRAVRLRSDQQASRQYWTILGISTLPVIVLAGYVFKLVKVFDFTPMTLAISMAMVVIVVWSRRNYDFRHLAAEKVLENLGDGVIALDAHDRLVSYNRAAADIFTCLPAHKLGENIRVLEEFREEMLNEDIPQSFSINGQHYESHSKKIIDENGRKQGCVILILDMTDIKAYINEIKRVRQQAEKASIAKRASRSSVPFSRRGRGSTLPGKNSREIPRMRPVLQDTEPTAFPRAIPPEPWAAAMVETSSSGMVVPRLTTVAATTKGGMPVTLAIHSAPSTKLSPPFTISTRPSKNSRITPVIVLPLPICCRREKLPRYSDI